METRRRIVNSAKFVAVAIGFVQTLISILGVALNPVSYALLAALGCGCGWWRWPGQWSLALSCTVGGLLAAWSVAVTARVIAVAPSPFLLMTALSCGVIATVVLRARVTPALAPARHRESPSR